MLEKGKITLWLADNRKRVTDEWFELLRFESIGADPAKLGDCAKCAAWLKKYLKALGFDVELVQHELASPPLVVAERIVPDSAHTVLFYGHYDVQPVDPISGWETPPFEPAIRGNRVYARGAQDDKGQLFSFLQGLRAVIELGGKLPSVRIVLEGQEESGSEAISALVYDLRERIAADILMACDTGKDPSGRPAIVAGLRGVMHFTVKLTGPAYDLHSGHHGGIAPNPAQGMAELLASLHLPGGSIAVEGFYAAVTPPSETEFALATEQPFDENAYRAEVGVDALGGEEGLPAVVRGSFRPTVEINGIHSGYGGPGSKTVIPAEAIGKISVRLVPQQSPREIWELLKKHLEDRCPRGMKLELSDLSGCEPGFRLPVDSPVTRMAQDVLRQIDPRGAVFHWEGASIPIIARLRDITGAAPLLVGFGMQEDRIHSPNESYSFEQFHQGALWGALILQTFAQE